MQSPRRTARPASSGSASAYESRSRSPLSTSASVDDVSSLVNDISSWAQGGSSRSEGRKSIHGASGWASKRSYTDPVVPIHNRYELEKEGRPPVPTTLLAPQRLRQEPKTWTNFVPHEYWGDGFQKLPQEVLLVILRELRKLHVHDGSLSCATCCMRDLHNLGLSSRKWWNAVQVVLYEDIQLVGSDSINHTKKKFKIKYGTRLRLLRRTLRSRPDLAKYVKVLKIPSIPEAAKTKQEQEEYLDLVASILMACPNLERFPGFYQPYDHEFNHYFHALTTRRKLVENVWFIEPSPFQRKQRYSVTEESDTSVFVPGPLHPEQYTNFLDLHSNWPQLQTLALHCNPEKLHWEITNPDDDKASDILVKSIAFSGFPSLRSIRAPTDFNGSIQKLCKPKARIELPGDKYRQMGLAGPNRASTMPTLPSPTRSMFSRQSNRDSLMKVPNASSSSLPYDILMESGKHEMMSLAAARQLAQLRIENGTKAQFDILIWDHDEGECVQRFKVGTFIGKVESKVVYNLKPDLDGSDESILGIESLLESGDEKNLRDGCTGSWNSDLDTRLGKASKGKDRWWHTERQRWREVKLDTFF
ncbi:F-box domain protein [Rutstroemia sp. NJR-2017a WRK4]|nr:F-box domain protein [Rutstroemia sp. NJR-2017a WRK4]